MKNETIEGMKGRIILIAVAIWFFIELVIKTVWFTIRLFFGMFVLFPVCLSLEITLLIPLFILWIYNGKLHIGKTVKFAIDKLEILND